MIGLLVFFIIVFAIALGFTWLADQEGSLFVLKIGEYQVAQDNLAVIAAFAFALLLVIILAWIIITMIWRTPGSIGGFFKTRRREKGWKALSEGMIAVGAGDTAMARKSAKNSAKFLPEEPVTKLLTAQAAQMEGKTTEARAAFEAMLDGAETKVVGLRGLYLEAEKAGEMEAARHFVETAAADTPGLEWSGNALLNMQAAEADWEGALVTLHQNADAKLYTKAEAKRLRAVLLTALAGQLEDGDPQKAKEKALEAHRLAPELVPAATIASRVLARLGDVRKASKIVEATWKKAPHPELMEAYTHVRPGDAGIDRLKRAEALNALRANHPEGIMGVARAQMDVQNFEAARKTMAGLSKSSPTERVCLLMSELEEAQYGDRGRVREWLSRAVRAPRDPVWTADGYIADEWAPVSPITGEIDAFEWRIPVEDTRIEHDLALEDIPTGPRELPELPVTSTTAATASAALVPADPENITYVKPDPAEIEDVIVEPVTQETTMPSSATSAENVIQMGEPAERRETTSRSATPVGSGPNAQPQPSPTPIRPTSADTTQEADVVDLPVSNDTKPDGTGDSETGVEPQSAAQKATPNSDTDDLQPSSADDKDAEMMPQGKKSKDAVADPIDNPQIDDPGLKDSNDEAPKKFRLF
ncbi:MAG: heme biosynthesis HemY N-terminal domain-containing protein [Pseudomonadota bacterium]